MAASPDRNSDTTDDFERCRRIWRTLIDEGVLQDKPPRELTVDDLDQINLRLSLEDHAAEDGMTVDQMFEEWGDDSKYVHGPFTPEEMMNWLNSQNEDDGGDEPDIGQIRR